MPILDDLGHGIEAAGDDLGLLMAHKGAKLCQHRLSGVQLNKLQEGIEAAGTGTRPGGCNALFNQGGEDGGPKAGPGIGALEEGQEAAEGGFEGGSIRFSRSTSYGVRVCSEDGVLGAIGSLECLCQFIVCLQSGLP